MKFKIDENLPVELVGDLVAVGHEVQTVPEEGLQGAKDPVLMELICREGRVLLTMDKGIGDIREYPTQSYAGIILFRPKATGRGTVLKFVRKHLPRLLNMKMDGRLFVVTEGGVRVHPPLD